MKPPVHRGAPGMCNREQVTLPPGEPGTCEPHPPGSCKGTHHNVARSTAPYDWFLVQMYRGSKSRRLGNQGRRETARMRRQFKYPSSRAPLGTREIWCTRAAAWGEVPAAVLWPFRPQAAKGREVT